MKLKQGRKLTRGNKKARTMTRTQQNPCKGPIKAPPVDLDKEHIAYSKGYVKKQPSVTLAVLTHYTHAPYHRARIPVVELCLTSIQAGLQGKDYELIIFDNGSTLISKSG